MQPIVDSHAHLDSPRYDEDREAMLVRARQAGVDAILSIGIGDGPATMQRAAQIAAEYAGRDDVPRIYASAGVHPHDAEHYDADAEAQLRQLCADPHVIAIGEIGLDYFYDHSPREKQREVFLAQMNIAAEARLPIIIHCRPSDGSQNAWDDTLGLLEEHWEQHDLGGVLHCFTGSAEHACRALDIGFMISFTGNITYPKAQSIRDVVPIVPADHLLVETDAPFLAPTPNRGKRNEPAWVARSAEQVAQCRNTTPDEIRAITTANFYRFFTRTKHRQEPLA